MLGRVQVHGMPWAAHTGEALVHGEGEPQEDTAQALAALQGMKQFATAVQLAGDPWGWACLGKGYPAEWQGARDF